MSSLAFGQPQATSGQPQAATDQSRSAASSRGSVLVVDDEPTIAEVVARYLQRAGYTTEIATDGARAMDAVPALRPDLIALDVKLPRIGGLEVLRRLRHEDARATVEAHGGRIWLGESASGTRVRPSLPIRAAECPHLAPRHAPRVKI